ncbi:PDC sensor domain-containing protein [Amorphus sp. MBR-141]
MKSPLFSGLCALALFAAPAFANEFEAPLTDLARGDIAAIASAPEIVAAVNAQNVQTAGYDQATIDAADTAWRAEIGSGSHPTIDSVLARPASAYLVAKKENSQGLFTEIFVMDAKGLNVAQSDVTSDFWQGDEAKWQETYPKGADAVHLSDVELDESTQTYQSQVSVPVIDNGTVIGAITVGVNVEYLQ